MNAFVRLNVFSTYETRHTMIADCPHPVAYNVSPRDRVVVSMLGYASIYRVKKLGVEPVRDRDGVTMRHVAITKSKLVIDLHTGNVLTWGHNSYDYMPRCYIVGAPLRGHEKHPSAWFAPGES